MSTMEHLFMQIFDRKQWIEGQIKQQVESYGETLAFSMLAEGKQPPPWLWASGFDAFDCPDPKGLSTEQLISGMLFPLPAFTGNNECQSYKFTETCASNKYIFTEDKYKSLPSASKLNPDMMAESEVVEACTELDPSTRIQQLSSRKRNQETHLAEQEKSTHHLGEMITGKSTRSRVGPVMEVNARESSAMKDSLHRHNTDGGRVTQSSSRSGSQSVCLQSLDKLLEPIKPSNFIEAGVQNGAKIQTDTQPVSSVNLNHLSCSTTVNARASDTRTPRNATVEPVLDTASHVSSSLKISSGDTPLLPDMFPLVEPKRLLCDGIEGHGLNKSYCISSEKKSQLSLANVFAHRELVQPVNADCFHRYLEKVDSSEKDVLQHTMEGDFRVSNCGVEQDGLQLLEFEDSESHSHPTLGHQNSQQDVNKKSSMGSLAGEQHVIELKEVLTACGSYKKSGLDVNSIAVSEETSECSVDKLKGSQSGKEASISGTFPAHFSSMNNEYQENVLPGVEVGCKAEEANIVSGQVPKDGQLLGSLESEFISLPRSNNRHSDATSFLKIKSGTSESNPTCSSPHSDSSKYDMDFSGHPIAIPDVRKKRSLRTPIQCPTEEKNREKLIKDTDSILIPMTNSVQNAGSALTSQTDKVLEAENAAVGVGKSTVQSQGAPTCTGTHDTIIEFRHSLRNSSNSDKNLGSCKLNGSSLPSLDNAAVSLSAQLAGNGSTLGIKKLTVAKILGTARSHDTQPKVAYSLRSSTSLIANLDSYLENSSKSCFEEDSLCPETNKIDISTCPADATEKPMDDNWVTPNGTEAQGAPTKARYFLRSRNSHDMNIASSRSSKSNSASCLEQAKETIPQAFEISWPKRRKVNYGSNNILATSPRIRVKHSQSIKENSNCSHKIEIGSRMEFQPISISAETKNEILNTSLVTPSESLHQSKKHSTIEGCSHLKRNSHSTLNTLTSEHATEEPLYAIADRKPQSYLKDETKISEATICKHQKHNNSEDYHDSLHEISESLHNSEEFSEDRELCGSVMSLHIHDTTNSPHYSVGLVGFDETMPEFEGFSIVSPSVTISNDSDLPALAKERASILEQLCKSRNVLTPVSFTPSNYKIHKVPDVYQSLSAGLLERMNLNCSLHFNDSDMEQFRENGNGGLGLQFDGASVGRPYSYSMPSSTEVDREARRPPLTPPLVKFGQKVVPGRIGASSEKVGSNPELICFRIDENSIIADENGDADEFDAFKDEISLSKELTNRKALVDITAEHQNETMLVSDSTKFLDRCSLEFVNSESYCRMQMSSHSSLAKGYADNRESKIEDKENNDRTVNKNVVRKAALSLRNRSSKPRMSAKVNERSRSHGNFENRCKHSNLVSNISSFVPLVQQKQQAAAPLKGRKDIKVKALEVAEASKRLEEKKQNEREMRKAAAKLEREKLEQENIRRLEHMQKQKEEERKKKEADIAVRKRQRAEEGKKEKGRKRRCIEETHRQKRELEGKLQAERLDKKLRHKASVVKEQTKKELVGGSHGQLKAENNGEFQCQRKTEMQPRVIKVSTVDDNNDHNVPEALEFSEKSNDIQKMVIQADGLQEVLQTRMSLSEDNQILQSYDITPYKDSDNEDGDDEIRREKKSIPLWARREFLDQIILSKQHVDPAKVFCKKSSFILSEVLPTRTLRRPV